VTIVEMFVKSALEKLDEDLAHLGSDHSDDQMMYLAALAIAIRERAVKLHSEIRGPEQTTALLMAHEGATRKS
jgi:hypothetical protein